jgi:phosphatidylserine decarboxylase precursor
VAFAKDWGSYLDTPASAKEVESFKSDPLFNWDEYMPPPSGFSPSQDYKAYRTFNQFFARHLKPGMRPIAGLRDNSVLVSPADYTFVGWWQIGEHSDIYVQGEKHGILEIKGIQWSIHELLKDSAYADRFQGGIFTHSFLNTFDYHRWHTPVQGKVLEARVIQGQAYLDVNVAQRVVADKVVNVLNALDGTGYQFVQTRGLIVIDSPIGLVACLPMGMAQVSSVVITAQKGVTLHKGEELGYFQFGGSDFVMVFERASNVQLITQPNVHYNQGTWIGNADPYTMS